MVDFQKFKMVKSFIQFLRESNFDPGKRIRRMSGDPAFKILELSNEFATFPEDMDTDEMVSKMDKELARAKNLPRGEIADVVRSFSADWEGTKRSLANDPEKLNKELRSMARSFVERQREILQNPSSAINPNVSPVKEKNPTLDFDQNTDQIIYDPGKVEVPEKFKPKSGTYLKSKPNFGSQFNTLNIENTPTPPSIRSKIGVGQSYFIPDSPLEGENFLDTFRRNQAEYQRQFGIPTKVTDRAFKTTYAASNLADPISSAAEGVAGRLGGKMAGSVAGMWGLADAIFGQEAHGAMIPHEGAIEWQKRSNVQAVKDLLSRGYNQTGKSSRERSN